MNAHKSIRSSTFSPFKLIDRVAKKLVLRRLKELKRGTLTIIDSGKSVMYGEPADLRATLHVRRPRFFRDAAAGTISIGESYLRGDWECDDLTNLFRLFIRNRHSRNRLDSGLSRLGNWTSRIYHWLRANTQSGSRRNIAAHYDLGNDFFQLWLDETMAYSSGVFRDATTTLRDASEEKFDLVCRKLDLKRGDDVIEIGTGWGGFAIHAARNFGCHVTTTTISKEQLNVAKSRIEDERLGKQVKLLQQDYRELNGQFDKLVSIEMIEAVGHQNLDTYFRQCGKLLRPTGSMVIQAIVAPERGYRQYLRSVDFLQRYVFPGGCLPSLEAILNAVGRATDLRLVHVEDFAPHYAETLRRWRHSFNLRLDEVRQLGYPDKFIRLWNYYLCYCEAAFEERNISLLQIQFDKPLCRRDAIPMAEHSIRSNKSDSHLIPSKHRGISC